MTDLQPVLRPTVRWVMDLGPIDEVCRLLFAAPFWIGATAIGMWGGIALGRVVTGWLGLT